MLSFLKSIEPPNWFLLKTKLKGIYVTDWMSSPQEIVAVNSYVVNLLKGDIAFDLISNLNLITFSDDVSKMTVWQYREFEQFGNFCFMLVSVEINLYSVMEQKALGSSILKFVKIYSEFCWPTKKYKVRFVIDYGKNYWEWQPILNYLTEIVVYEDPTAFIKN